MLQEIFLYILDVIRRRIDLLGGVDLLKVAQTRDQRHLTLQVLSLLDYAYRKLAAIARAYERGGQAGGEERKEPAAGDAKGFRRGFLADGDGTGSAMERLERDQIFPYLLDLLFESVIAVTQELTYEEVYFEYWDFNMAQGVEPMYELFGPVEGESYLKQICKYIKMYFRSHSADAPSEFQELLVTGSLELRSNKQLHLRSFMSINYR